MFRSWCEVNAPSQHSLQYQHDQVCRQETLFVVLLKSITYIEYIWGKLSGDSLDFWVWGRGETGHDYVNISVNEIAEVSLREMRNTWEGLAWEG